MALLMAACRQNDQPQRPATVAGKLIEVVVLDTTRTAPRDTLQRLTITWDTEDRPSVIKRMDYEFMTTPRSTQLDFFYAQSSDTVAYRFDEQREIQVPSRSESWLQWSNGRLILDSIARQNMTPDIYRIGPAGNPTRMEYGRLGSAAPTVTNFYQTWAGPNLTYQLDSSRGIGLNDDPAFSRTTITSNYLNIPNPFYRLAKVSYWHNLRNESYDLSHLRSAPQNLLSERRVETKTWMVAGGNPYNVVNRTPLHYRYHYVFNGAGQAVRITELGTPNTNQHRVLLLRYE